MDRTKRMIFAYIKMMVCGILCQPLVQLADGHYFELDEYFDDLGQAYRAEIKELYYLGCRKHFFASLNNLATLNRFYRTYTDR